MPRTRTRKTSIKPRIRFADEEDDDDECEVLWAVPQDKP